MSAWGKSAVLVMGMWLIMLGPGMLRGEELKKDTTPTEIPAEMEEKPPERVGERPGDLPGVSGPDKYGTLGLGPSGGPLAPYGNASAYDSLQRGWRSHRLGKLILTPYFASDGLYRSNIFLTPTDKKSDFIAVLSPGLRAELPIAGRHRLSVGYLGGGFIYTRFSSQSHYNQNINVDMTLNFRGGTSLRFGNGLRLATEERNSEFSLQRRYLWNSPYVNITRALADRWKLEGSYQFNILQFVRSQDRFNNYNQHDAGVTLYYKFWPKTAALMQYIFTYREYPEIQGDNNYAHSPLVGLAWDPTAKLSGTAKFGYTFKQYDTDFSSRNNTPEGWILSANILYRYNRYTNLTLRAQRSLQEDVDFTNSGYRNTGVWVSLNHEWHYFRVYSYANFFYLNNDYLSPTLDLTGQFKRRHDDIIGAGVGLSRPITRRLRARIDYSYSNRGSNFFGYAYNDHRVLFGLSTSL